MCNSDNWARLFDGNVEMEYIWADRTRRVKIISICPFQAHKEGAGGGGGGNKTIAMSILNWLTSYPPPTMSTDSKNIRISCER